MRISSNLQLGFITCGNTVRVTCTNTYYKPKKPPKIKVNVFNMDGELIQSPENEYRVLRRARVAVVDYALCNRFDYFGTITFNDAWHDVTNALACRDSILNAFDNYKKRYSSSFQYILIGEYGEKTHRLHFHFLVKGINKDDLFINRHHKLDWAYTSERFGFTQICKIGNSKIDHERVARYCSKYITKENIRISNHRYFCSKGLVKPSVTREYNPALTILVSDWLEENLQMSYSHTRMGKAFSIPKRIYQDLLQFIELCKYNMLVNPCHFEILDSSVRSPFDEVQLCLV